MAWSAFGDFLNQLDDSLAALVALVLPIVALLVAGWVRELLLASRARQAALKAEIQAFDSVDEITKNKRIDLAVGHMKSLTPPLLFPSDDKLRFMVERAQPEAEREAMSTRGPQNKLNGKGKK